MGSMAAAARQRAALVAAGRESSGVRNGEVVERFRLLSRGSLEKGGEAVDKQHEDDYIETLGGCHLIKILWSRQTICYAF